MNVYIICCIPVQIGPKCSSPDCIFWNLAIFSKQIDKITCHWMLIEIYEN